MINDELKHTSYQLVPKMQSFLLIDSVDKPPDQVLRNYDYMSVESPTLANSYSSNLNLLDNNNTVSLYSNLYEWNTTATTTATTTPTPILKSNNQQQQQLKYGESMRKPVAQGKNSLLSDIFLFLFSYLKMNLKPTKSRYFLFSRREFFSLSLSLFEKQIKNK